MPEGKKPRKVREPRISERDVFKIVRAVRHNYLQDKGIISKSQHSQGGR